MKSVEYDLRYIEAGREELEGYLLSKEVFWPLGVKPPEGKPDYPQLTLDWMLLSSARLSGRRLSGAQNDQVERAISDLDLHRSKWRVAWEKKAGHCYQVRGRMWRDYLQEYKDNPQDNADRYTYEIRLRVMLELLRNEFRQQTPEVEFLMSLDGYLKIVLEPGGFIWEPEIEAGFPVDKFWFLYGKLPPTVRRY
jgi:hypothetical protein